MPKNTLAETISVVVDAKLEGVHTSLPGRVESYNYKSQKATVKPLVSKRYLDKTVQELPVLVNVPVVFPRTKTSGITFPINKGDGVLLVFAERSLERWYSSGSVVEPGDKRKFDLSDAIAIPGCFSFADTNLASNNDDLEIHHKDFKIVITKTGKIKIIGLGGEELIKIFDDWMTQMKSTQVITGIGLQPFSPTSIAAMNVIQLRLKKLLG